MASSQPPLDIGLVELIVAKELHSILNASYHKYDDLVHKFDKNEALAAARPPKDERLMALYFREGMNLSGTGKYFNGTDTPRDRSLPNRFDEVKGMIQTFDPALYKKDLKEADFIRAGFVRPEVFELQNGINELRSAAFQVTTKIHHDNTPSKDTQREGRTQLEIRPNPKHKQQHEPEEKLYFVISEDSFRAQADRLIMVTAARVSIAARNTNLRGMSYDQIEAMLAPIEEPLGILNEKMLAWVAAIPPRAHYYEHSGDSHLPPSASPAKRKIRGAQRTEGGRQGGGNGGRARSNYGK